MSAEVRVEAEQELLVTAADICATLVRKSLTEVNVEFSRVLSCTSTYIPR